MTANQIEYWKLQETKRHNIMTEQMDIPLKKSQTEYNYASVNLMQEQVATQETVRAMNLASAAASYASAQNQDAQAALNQERTVTEQYQREYVMQQIEHEKAETTGQTLKNEYQTVVNEYADENMRYDTVQNMYNVNVAQYQGTKARDMYGAWIQTPGLYASVATFSNVTGLSGDNLVNDAVKVWQFLK